MWKPSFNRWKAERNRLASYVFQPFMLSCIPALCLAVYWWSGQPGLIALTVGLPLVFILLSGTRLWIDAELHSRTTKNGLFTRDGFETFVEQCLETADKRGLYTAAFIVELEDQDVLTARHGQSAADTVLRCTADRIVSALRDSDAVTQCGDSRFAICLSAVRQLDLELCIQLSGRIQAAIEEPVSVDGTSIYVTAAIGFCQGSWVSDRDSKKFLDNCHTALREAKQNGPSAIRAFSDEMRQRVQTKTELREDVREALENGHIVPWFQPQISTDTGRVTGFEALARWSHPDRGMIPPNEFLPAIEEAALLERLAEIMIFHALTAVRAWDAAGADVPQVGVNFAGPELNNPRLVEKVQWELDRFDLTPDRLAVEILETVISDTPGDMVARNVKRLGELGCRIDLDDFGTGHASIASIRRFSVGRIKIDRSFVMKSDRDPEQQRMISAILTMAERLNVETLAEGVETVGEHALLAQLGCNHVQGFGIGKPMPFDQTLSWIAAHNAKLADAPAILQSRAK